MPAPATTGHVLLTIAVILLAAGGGGLLFRRLGQPAVVGEIAAGVALGPTLLGALPGDLSNALFPASTQAVLQPIGQLGLVLFMFTVGWDLDLRIIRRRRRAAAAVSAASIVLPFALGLLLAARLHARHEIAGGAVVPFAPFAFFIAAAMAVTAFPVLARILEETRLSATSLGGITLSAAAIDDVVGWTILAVALSLLGSSGSWDGIRILLELAAFIALTVRVIRPLLHRLLRDVSPARAALVLPAALAGAAATDAIGIHAVFGAFLVGAAMPRVSRVRELAAVRAPLTPVVGLLGPVYFVTAGMAVNLPGLHAGDLADLALIVATACAGKFAGAFAGARLAGSGAREAAAIGVLMNTRGVVAIVLVTVGRDAGVIDGRLVTLLLLMALVTTLVTTPILRRLKPVDSADRLEHETATVR